MKVAKEESMPNVVVGSMVLASLICMLPAVTIAPEMAFLIFSSGYSIVIYFNCIWRGSGKVAAFTVGEFHREGCGPGNRIQLHQHSGSRFTYLYAYKSDLTQRKPHQNPAPGTWLAEPGLKMTT